MPTFLPAHGPEIERLFGEDSAGFSDCKAQYPGGTLDFQLVQSATNLAKSELETCLNLIEGTSGHQYKSSSVGWNRKEKLKEMMDSDMMYLLIRQGNTTLKRKRSVHTEPGDQYLEKQGSASGTGFEHSDKGGKDSAAEATHDSSTNTSTMTASRRFKSASPHQSHTGNILGFLSFMFTFDDPPYEDREVVYIYEIHLNESLRGFGFGSKMIKFAERAAERCSISKTMLTVFTSNERARALYSKLGYEKDICSPKDRAVRNRVIKADYVIMSKELPLGHATKEPK